MDPATIAMLANAGVGIFSSLMGGKSAQGGAKDAAQSQINMYEAAQNNLNPYMDMGLMAKPYLNRLATNRDYAYGGLNNILNQYRGMKAPRLQSEVGMDLENDPIYQAQADEMANMLNRKYGSMGGMEPSAADDAMTRNVLPFMQDSYSRGLDEMNRENQNALTRYGLQSDKLSNTFQMKGGLADTEWNRLFQMGTMGANAAAHQGQNAMQTGNALSQINMAGGQAGAEKWGNMGGAVMGGLNNYMLYNMLNKKQSPTSWGGAAQGF